MENLGCFRPMHLVISLLQLHLFLFHAFRQVNGVTHTKRIGSDIDEGPPVTLHVNDENVVMCNGILNVTLSNPEGTITAIQYNNIDNVLETNNHENDRGYWDSNWSKPGFKGSQQRLSSNIFKVIAETEEQVEISFSKRWTNSSDFAVNVDKRFIMLRGTSGFYTYSIFERMEGWPEVDIAEMRVVFKLNPNMFRYMAISNKRQRLMPMRGDRSKGEKLDYPEAILLRNPTHGKLDGEVDDKYQYSCNNEDNKVHGWIAEDPGVGFWMITPSNEFRIGGPLRQDLTSHSGPVVLSMFISTHYAGRDTGVHFNNGEPWEKLFGPVFVYLNSYPMKPNYNVLWRDAYNQMLKERRSWPYSFPLSNYFTHCHDRGSVTGHLFVHDRHSGKGHIPAASAYVGLAPPGEAGSWQYENKGYQFWTRADSEGKFEIFEVLPEEYNLFAWVPGVLGDYKYEDIITIIPGDVVRLKRLVFQPPRNGRTLWEIGLPDRTAAEFFIPDPEPTLFNPLYKHFDRFRQYGLWRRYSDLYPHKDLVYKVGVSNYSNDWFYAHVTRKIGELEYQATTWQIKFNLHKVCEDRNYTLWIALASANEANLQVRVNQKDADNIHFSTGHVGKDNAIARHGIHGMYRLFDIKVPGFLLLKGENTIFLKQSMGKGRFNGVMYDYIRFEGPSRRKAMGPFPATN